MRGWNRRTKAMCLIKFQSASFPLAVLVLKTQKLLSRFLLLMIKVLVFAERWKYYVTAVPKLT